MISRAALASWFVVTLRSIPVEAPTFAQLNLPDVVRQVAEEERGIVLVTGTTGSGKSTTLAAMIDAINKVTTRNVITVEDPIEFLHRDRLSFIHQREVGLDTRSFHDGLVKAYHENTARHVEEELHRLQHVQGVSRHAAIQVVHNDHQPPDFGFVE